MAAIDVTDETFEAEVLDKSNEVPVVVDLWAEWCGPCKTLGPILEKVIDATDGKVVLAKIDVDANPALGQAFKVQSIPAVYAMHHGKVVDGFMGAYPESAVQDFVDKLLPTEEQNAVAELLAAGDEGSLRIALGMEPANEDVIVALGELLVADDRGDEALELLARIPESDRTRTNPGVALRTLLASHGPALILIDEWVAYARQLHDQGDLPGGSFETHFTFAQALTDADE